MHFEAFACLRLSRRSRREPPGGAGRRASAPPFSARKCGPRPVHACDPPSYMQPTESKRRKPDTFTKPSRSQTLAFALRFLKTRAQDPCLTWPNGKSLQQRACAGIHNSHGRDPARHTAWQLQAAGQMHQLFPPARLVVYDLRIRVAGPRRVTRPATNRATIGTMPMDDKDTCGI